MSHRQAVFQDGGIGQPLDYRIAAHANALDKELAYKGEQERLQRKQTERDNAITDISNVKVGDTGLNPVDAVKNQAVPALQNEAFKRLQAGQSPLAVKAWLNPEVAKLSSAYTLAKNSKDIADKNFLDIAKAYPKADMGKLKSMVYGDISNDIVQKGEDGSYGGLKDASVIPLDKDYTGPYLDPQNLGKWYNASGELKEYAEGLKLNEVSDSDKFDDKGKVIKHGYKGKSNFLSRPITDPKTGDVIGQETAYDEVDDGNGNKLKVLPETQEREILAGPRRAAELNQIVAPEIAEIESATGKEIDPKQAHLIMRNRLYQIMDQHKTHTFNTNDEVRIPKPPVTKITVNNAANIPTSHVYEDVETRVDKTELGKMVNGSLVIGTPVNELPREGQDQVIAIANGLRHPSGSNGKEDTDEEFNQKNLLLRKRDDGTIWIVDKTLIPERVNPKSPIPDSAWIAPYEKAGANKAQSKKEYGVKSAQKSGMESNKPNPKPTAKKDPLGIL